MSGTERVAPRCPFHTSSAYSPTPRLFATPRRFAARFSQSAHLGEQRLEVRVQLDDLFHQRALVVVAVEGVQGLGRTLGRVDDEAVGPRKRLRRRRQLEGSLHRGNRLGVPLRADEDAHEQAVARHNVGRDRDGTARVRLAGNIVLERLLPR